MHHKLEKNNGNLDIYVSHMMSRRENIFTVTSNKFQDSKMKIVKGLVWNSSTVVQLKNFLNEFNFHL